MNAGYKLQSSMPPQSFSIMNGGQVEVMRITVDGVHVNPTLPVDEAAQYVIKALDQHIKQLVAAERAHIIAICDELANKYESMTPPMHAHANIIDEVVATIQDRRQNT